VVVTARTRDVNAAMRTERRRTGMGDSEGKTGLDGSAPTQRTGEEVDP
jgi:hypothetical protein